MILERTNYREILSEVFASRCERNPRYSLRAFARDCGVTSGRLSEVLSGKQGLSRQSAAEIARSLGFAQMESEYFCDLADSQHARSRVQRRIAEARLRRFQRSDVQQLQLDTFRVVSDWYHFVILELTAVDGFRSDPEWIGRRLGVPTTEIRYAIERLKKLELLEETPEGLRATSDVTFGPDGVPSEAVRKFQMQLLEKAGIALGTLPIEKRTHWSSLLAVNESQMPEAKKMIREFRKRFSEAMQATKVKDEVFCFSVQFFQITKGDQQ